MDKTQHKAIDWMFETAYRPVLTRCIVNLVLLDISNIMKGVKLNYRQLKEVHSGAFNDKQLLEILHTDSCREALVSRLLSNHVLNKGEIIQEVIKQYGLSLNREEIDLYHEKMGIIFMEEATKIRELLEAYAYGALYELSKIVEQH